MQLALQAHIPDKLKRMSSFGAKRKARVIKVDFDDDESSGDAPSVADGGTVKDGT